MTRAHNALSISTEQRIIKAIEAGIISQSEIAREMGLPPKAVHRVVARYKKAHPKWVLPERRNQRFR